MPDYKCLIRNKFKINQYQLIPLREEDIYKIKKWRNEQMDVLRQKRVLTNADQGKYFKDYVLPNFSEEYPTMILFSFLDENNNLIGYGGLTNIDWESKRAEISFLVDTSRITDKEIYRSDFGSFLKMIKQVAFDDLKFNRLFTETYDIRPLHISILEENNLRAEGRMKEHVYINGSYVDSLLHGCLKSYYESEK